MPLAQLIRVIYHWSLILGTPLIHETLILKKFGKIRESLHLNDSTKKNPDQAWILKIHPMVDSLNEAYSKVALTEYPWSEKQISFTKARNNVERY